MKTLGGWLRSGNTLAIALMLGALSGCSDLLEVDLPAELTDNALEDPKGAETQVNSIIAKFEDAYNEFFWVLHGREDGGEIVFRSPGVDQVMTYSPNQMPFGTFSQSRNFAFFLHDKLAEEWTVQQVARRAQFMATSSIYAGAVLSIMGSSLCEVTIDTGPLMAPDEVYNLAEQWLTQAITEVNAAGDFELPFGIASSAEELAYGLRAQLRWMRGDLAGARADAEQVHQGFEAFVTREARPGRRNIAYEAGSGQRFARLYDVIDWWEPVSRSNPVTGQNWPQIIPFTGYVNLGILPDGRAIRDDGVPVRTAGDYRTTAEDAAVPDTRVRTEVATIQGTGLEGYVNAQFDGEGSPITMVNWKEMWLIRAEAEGGQGAIDLVNQMRAADGLPLVTYADPGNAEQIRTMIIEERRRALFLQGRFYYTKLKNLDLLWFPRNSGELPTGGQFLQGGIRFVMPENEFQLNDNLTLNDQATGCHPNERPILVG